MIELLLLLVVASACGDAAQFDSFDEVGSQAVGGALPGSPPRTEHAARILLPVGGKTRCLVAMAFGGQTPPLSVALRSSTAAVALCAPRPPAALCRCMTFYSLN